MSRYLPFYMVYNTDNLIMPDSWSDDSIARRDYDYMKSAYPNMAKYIMPYVEEECDRLEYSGSMMFDEYPDQLQMRILCRRIYEKVRNDKTIEKKLLMELIQVITWHEILKRREEYRKYKRKFY